MDLSLVTEWDAEIDAELSALSDCDDSISSINGDKLESLENLLENDNSVDWMELFLEKTRERTRKFEDNLFDAETVLKEIDRNVVECHSRVSTIQDEGKGENAKTNQQLFKDEMLETDRFSIHTIEELNFEKNLAQHNIETDLRLQEFEAECQQEMLNRIDDIEMMRIASEKTINEIKEAEKKILFNLIQEKHFHENQRKNRAACIIQSNFRRFFARKQYGLELDRRIKIAKEERTKKRIQELEEKRREREKLETEFYAKLNNETTADDLSEKADAFQDNRTVVSFFSVENKMKDAESSDQNTIQFFHTEISSSSPQNIEVLKKEATVSDDQPFVESVDISNENIQIDNDNSIIDQNIIHEEQEETVDNVNDTLIAIHDIPHPCLEMKSVSISDLSTQTDILAESENINCKSIHLIPETVASQCLKSKYANNVSTDCGGGVIKEKLSDTTELTVNLAIDHDLKILEKSVNLSADKIETDNNILTSTSKTNIQAVDSKENLAVTSTSTTSSNTIADITCDIKILEASVHFISQASLDITPKHTLVHNVAGKNTLFDISHGSDVPTPNRLCKSSDLTNVHSSFGFKNSKSSPNQSLPSLVTNSNLSLKEIGILHLMSTTSPSLAVQSSKNEQMTSSGSIIPNIPFSPMSDNPLPNASNEVNGDINLVTANVDSSPHLFNNTNSSNSLSLSVDDNDPVTIHADISEKKLQVSDETSVITVMPDTEPSSYAINAVCEAAPCITEEKANMKIDNMSSPVKGYKFNTTHLIEHNFSNFRSDLDRSSTDKSETLSAMSPSLSPKNACNDPLNRSVSLTSLWQRWKDLNLRSDSCNNIKVAKPQLKRTIRKSSAAKRLPPISEEDIIKGKWPYFKDSAKPRALEHLSRIYIKELDGLGKNLTVIHRCVNLTHLTLIQCGLVSLEGLQSCPSLRYIDVSCNDISVVSCDGMKRLESLVVIQNRLTSIHGLAGCNSLLVLDMSENNITKINGLEETRNLSHLRLANNQLMNVKGLSSLDALLNLDVSSNNLSTLDGIENCALLRCLRASDNCFTVFPAQNLINCILLLDLDLSGNSIADLDLSFINEKLFLPMLSRINLKRNKLSFENDGGNCRFAHFAPFLTELCLSQNFISIADTLIFELKELSRFRLLILADNVFTEEQADDLIRCCQSNFEISFDSTLPTNKVTETTEEILVLPCLETNIKVVDQFEEDLYARMTAKQLDQCLNLVFSEMEEVKQMSGWKMGKSYDGEPTVHVLLKAPPELISRHCQYLNRQFELAANQRHAQEAKNPKCYQISNPDLTVPRKSCDAHCVKASENLALQSSRFMEASTSKSSLQDNLESKAKIRPLFERKSCPLENVCAIKIQSFWRGYYIRKRYRNLIYNRNRAANVIQSSWRKYVAKKNSQVTNDSFKFTNEDLNMDEFGEVDLSELDFDEALYEEQWAVRTNTFPDERHVEHTILCNDEKGRSFAGSPHYNKPDLAVPSFQDTIDNNQTIWQKLASISKPPLPPITPTGSTTESERQCSPDIHNSSTSHVDSHRSRYSKREELLANEWGLHSSTAAELMLKRARRMKVRKKKQVNAEEKLRRFQDLKQKVTERPLMKVRKHHSAPSNRLEYFKAREIEFESDDKKPKENDERRQQYTYEWLHTRANCSSSDMINAPPRGHDMLSDTSARVQHTDGSSIKSGFLPRIPRHRTSFSEHAHHHDLEVLSVSSHTSNLPSKNKHLLRDIARRHGDFT